MFLGIAESKFVAKLAQSDMIGENHIVTLSGMMKYCYFVGNDEVLLFRWEW